MEGSNYGIIVTALRTPHSVAVFQITVVNRPLDSKPTAWVFSQ
jgi:hypothetical protein